MKTLLTVCLLVASTVVGQEYVSTYHPKLCEPVTGNGVLVISVTDKTHPDYDRINNLVGGMKRLAVPALFDLQTGLGVSITGSLQNAKVGLHKLKRESATSEIKTARKLWNRGVKALYAAEGAPLGTNTTPNVTVRDFVMRMGALTNTPTQARMWAMQNAMNAVLLLEQNTKPLLTEDTDQ